MPPDRSAPDLHPTATACKAWWIRVSDGVAATLRGRRGGDARLHGLLLLAILVALPLAILAVYAACDPFGGARVWVEDGLRANARATAIAVDHEFARTEAALSVLSQSAALARGDIDPFAAEMQAASSLLGGIPLELYAGAGRVVATPPRPDRIGDEQRVGSPVASAVDRVLSTGRTDFSDLIRSPGLASPVIRVSTPVSLPGRSAPAFVLSAALSAARLAAILQEVSRPDAGTWAVLLDRSGHIAAASAAALAPLVGQPATAALGEAATGVQDGTVRSASPSDGQRLTIAFARAPRSGYILAQATPLTAVPGPLRRMVVLTAAVGTVLVSFGLIAAWLLAQGVVAARRGSVAARPDALPLATGLRELDEAVRLLGHAPSAQGRGAAELQLLFEVSPIGIGRLDRLGRLVAANQALRDTIRRTPAEIEGKLVRWHAIAPPERHEGDAGAATVEAGRCVPHETELLVEGRRVPVLVAMAVPPGGTGDLAVFVVDQTERKQAEAELRRLTAELQDRVRREVAAREAAQVRATHAERMQALGQLAGGIAHDFNNVLQTVTGAAELIDRRSAQPDTVRSLARLVLDAAGRGEAITHRLLVFARRGALRADAVEPAELLEDMRALLALTLGAGIRVEVDAPPDLPCLLADRGQLETVLVNLATNARDAMPRGGRLTLSAALSAHEVALPQAALAAAQYVQITVADTGDGMDAATLARVTEPFFTTKPPGKGTGLGLAMARGFAEQSGGALLIESTPGVGTSVTLWLPLADAAPVRGGAADAAPAAPVAAVPEDSSCILLVDDDPLVLEALGAQLSDCGYAVVLADDAYQALDELTSSRPVDLMVTDLTMPGIDGLSLIRTAQEHRPGLPVILLSGFAADETGLAVDGAMSGSFSLMRKPVRFGPLASRVAAMLAEAAADQSVGGRNNRTRRPPSA